MSILALGYKYNQSKFTHNQKPNPQMKRIINVDAYFPDLMPTLVKVIISAWIIRLC